MEYAVLHAHDTYGSIGDSILYIKDYVAKAKTLGIKHLAITNHGSLATMVSFYEECKANNINPIIGCEFYYVDNINVKDKKEKRNHLIVLAKNMNGVRNIIQMHNQAMAEGFYYKPRIDFEMLKKWHADTICLSACLAGRIPQLLVNDEHEAAFAEAKRFRDLYGSDFYLELQPGRFAEQYKANTGLMDIAKELNIKMVLTNDIHYLNKEDWQIHDYHVKDARKMSLDEAMVYPDKCYYLMSRKELVDMMAEPDSNGNSYTKKFTNSLLDNTLEIAKQINIVFPEEHFMPCFDPKIDEAKTLMNLCAKRLQQLKLTGPQRQAYIDRLDFELNTIKTLGFSGYFLIVKDFIDYCEANDIAHGPGRGSAVGSLVSYLLGISIADPMRYGLMFERFLSVDRKSNPDIDLDIDSNKRSLLYQHIVDRYGADHCCFVSTFNKRKARNAIKTAARILQKPIELSDRIAKLIPMIFYDDDREQHRDLTIEEAYEAIPEFKDIADANRDIVDLAIKLEGFPSSTGIHPAGIVISPVSITDRYPLVRCKNEMLMAAALDLSDVEKLSGVKFDLLALSSLAAIDKTLKDLKISFDYTDESILSEKAVWDVIGSDNTTGLFQISSSTYKTRMPQLHPHCIEELAACLALVRGPCISSGADRKYIDIINGRRQPNQICKEYWKITRSTNGIIIYQEQVLKVCQELGMSSVDSYHLLKACSKKKADKIAAYREKFYESAKNKIDIKTTDLIWNEIMNSAKYAFNVSHATAYALLCYASAWLKIHYPLEYMSNVLSKVFLKPDAVTINDTVRDCKRLGLQFKEVDINKSDWAFTTEKDYIRIGMCAIKGLGEKAYENFSSLRPFKNFSDFIERVSGRACNKRCIQLLALSNAFDSVSGMGPSDLTEYYTTVVRKEKDYDHTIKVAKDNINIRLPRTRINKMLMGADFKVV